MVISLLKNDIHNKLKIDIYFILLNSIYTHIHSAELAKQMARYKTYDVENFATDEMFRKWILCPTPEISCFWKQWLSENPDKSSIVKQASELITAVNESYSDHLSPELVNIEIQEITRLAEIKKRNKTFSKISVQSIWRIAAMFLLGGGLGGYFYSEQNQTKLLSKQNLTSLNAPELLIKANNTSHEITVLLSDNSVATLMKGSSLTYPSRFDGNERKVSLSGEAFFDITKDPKKPFLVFAHETVTKVLGTSFRVRAFEKDDTVMVVVKTGKVSVYPMKEYEKTSMVNNREITGVVLSPNQQVVFIRNQNRLEKGIVTNPEMLSESSITKDLIFDDKPVTEVLQTLENIYGIVILFDKERLNNCVISAQFDEENLKQRMNAICQAIGASYEMVDGQIIINSNGCG